MLWLLIGVIAFFCFILWLSRRPATKTDFPRKYKAVGENDDHYDVIIVGAGPSGSSLAYNLGKQGRKVLLVEKGIFPRDKYCGNAVCKIGIEILHEMGILQDLINNNKAHVADCGGLCSPSGLTYVSHSKEILGDIPAAIACKRIILDEALVHVAQKKGANLMEGYPVKDAKFDKNSGLWTVYLDGNEKTLKGRVLVCADGAPSKLATQLGLFSLPPQGSCSRAYVEPGTHRFDADGVVFYDKDMLPGYSALLRHPNNELNYCVYIIPGNPKVTNDTLPHWHEYLIKNDPNISKSLGKNAKLERMKAASLRFWSQEKTYDDHLLVVGDAAGFIDPLTGEGIHTALLSGKYAAEILKVAFDSGNFDKELLMQYEKKWYNDFGKDFYWSMKICQLLYRHPILLDAATAAIIRKGDKFFTRWVDIMTGRSPKFNLLHPEIITVVGYEITKLLLNKVFG